MTKPPKTAVVNSRIGQGQFRAALVEYWGSCAITGCEAKELLQASHIKPWKAFTNHERLDPYNGLLLLPNLQLAFDKELITFENNGDILISSRLGEEALLQLGINHSMRLRFLESQHLPYLQHHCEHIFLST